MHRRYYIYMFPAMLMLLGLLGACRAGKDEPPAAASAATTPTKASWPMYRGNPAMTGHVRENLPDDPKRLWRFATGDAVRSTPAIDNATAYFGSYDGKVYAVSLRDGQKRWAHHVGEPVESSPLLLEELLIVGAGDGKVYALDLETGKPRWSAETGGKVNASPNVATLADGTQVVLVGSYDGKLHCFEAATGKPRWAYDTENYVNGAAAVLNLEARPHVAFGGCDSKLRLLDVENGELIDATDLQTYIPATVATAGNIVYAATFDAKLFALELPATREAWTYRGDKDQPFFSSPAVGEGKVLIGDRAGTLHCLAAEDGRQLWTHDARDAIDSSAVIVTGDAGSRVVVGSDDGRLYLLDLATGESLWTYRLGEPVTAAPAVAGGMILVGCDDGYLYAFGAER